MLRTTSDLRTLSWGAVLLATLVACSGPDAAPEPKTTQEARPLASQARIVGYFPTWQGDVNAIQYDKLTHINYAFLLPTAQGGIYGVSSSDSRMQALIQNAHARGVKVLIAVGGWMDGNDAPFEQLAANPSTRTAFVNNLVGFVTAAGLDGVDIDWEWPEAGASAQNFGALMRELGVALHSRGKLLTAAVVGSWGGEGIPASSFSDVDFLNIMAYDGGYPHSPYSFAVQSLNYWLGRGLPKEKAVLGVPFYGRSQSTALTYAELVARDPQAPFKDNVGDVYYNGIPTIQEKTRLAMQQGGGIMIWEISQDTRNETSLLGAIYQVIQGGGGNNQAPSVSLTSPSNGATFSAGSTVTLSANASDTDGTIARVEFFAGATKVGEDTSAPYSIAWTNVAAGSYALTAQATDSGGAKTTSAAVSITVTGTGGSCAGVAPWSPSQVYVKDDQATYSGSLWRAKWWTQNEAPSTVEWGPWQRIGGC